eukprot:TRINITY_DN46937_c0_g1_i1.p1 TRINITY_DN46937_c0_g1~~TRINITY_DN46937_c0_g1_i1.p1  ORF type:complete len:224 (+),score=65.01 TRINITY_DN46937_c0_g1_i1:97-768(+)
MPPVDEEAEALAKHWQAVAFRGAVDKGDMEVVEELIANGFQTTYKMTNNTNWTVLMIAANAGQKEMVEKFTKGARMPKIDDKDPQGLQAIHLAALKGHRDIVELLIEKKAEVNAVDVSGETSLMKAAAEGHHEVVKLLLEKGADPDVEDCNGVSAIRKACSWGRVECLRELLPKVAPNARQLKHCLLFGRLNKHDAIVEEMNKVFEREALEDAEKQADTLAQD